MLARLALAALALTLLAATSEQGRPGAVLARAAAHDGAVKTKPRHRPRAKRARRPPVPKPARPAAPSTLVPDDPWWSSEWGLAQIGMPALWRAAAAWRGTGALIAVVDTGVDSGRADLAGAVVAGYGPVDSVGHGTAVAEVAAARGDDGVGAAGVCWRCRILPVDVAPAGVATAADLAAGIRYAADQGANVINLSMVLTGPDDGVAAAIADAQARGALVVAAAGNDGGTAATYPAAYPGVVGVVALDEAGRLYPWSTHGPWAAFAAPGCATVEGAGGSESEFCGSSAAAPVVSGLAGLLWSSGLGSADAVRAALTAAAAPVDGSVAGVGRVDAAALAARLSG